MPTVVVPVGFDMGAIYAEAGDPDRSPMHYEVHLGGDPQDLTADQYTAWLGAFHDVEAHADLLVDRVALERHLRTDPEGPAGPLTDPRPLVQELLDRGLLLQYDTGDVREDVFAGLRLFPRAHGLGDTTDSPEFYAIGYPGRSFATIDNLPYQLWSLSLTFPSLWDALVDFAEGDGWDIPPGEEKPSPAEVGGMLGQVLPLLVSSGAAFLDQLNYDPPRLTPTKLDGNASAAERGSSILVPVGLHLGEDFTLRAEADRGFRRWVVHVGTEWVELDHRESSVYLTAFNRRDLLADGRLDRAGLAKAVLRADGPERPEPLIDDLVDRGLLVEYDPEEGSLERLFRAVQLFPLGRGFGNSPDHPERYQIGIDGPAMWVTGEVYRLWSYSLTEASLWDACASLAAVADEDLPVGEEPLNYTADELAHLVAQVLPALVAHGCAFLDPLNYQQ